MKTNQLIDMLSTNVEPVKHGQLGKTLAWALVIGVAASFCVICRLFASCSTFNRSRSLWLISSRSSLIQIQVCQEDFSTSLR